MSNHKKYGYKVKIQAACSPTIEWKIPLHPRKLGDKNLDVS